MTTGRVAAAVGLAALLASPGAAQEVEVSGYLAGELRAFVQTPALSEQLQHWQPSFLAEPELRIGSEDRRHEVTITPFVRLDGADEDRSHVDLREAFWRGVFGDWEVLVGANTVFWGVTESRHLVDVINQIDLLEDIDEEDKLGQPMVTVEWQQDWGRLSGFALIGFRELAFPGESGRLRFPLPILTDQARFPDGRRDVDLAGRYSHFFGDFDLGVYVFHGTGREASFEATATDEGTPALIPVYHTITQVGLDLQYTRDAWLWKVETIGRSGHGDPFAAAVAGVEYTLFQLGGTAADLGLLGEYLYDGRDEAAPPVAFENDVFAGTRLALNDTQDTSVLAGAIVDLEDGSVAARVEATRRLTDRLTLEVESRLFTNVAESSFLRFFRRDSFLAARLSFFL